VSRFAALMGLLLGAVTAVGGVLGYVNAGSKASLIAGLGLGLTAVGFAAWTFRRRGFPLIGLCVVALALLGRFLPAYFQTYQVWPHLILIALASLTFGFGLLGFLLDRYAPPEGPRSHL
jgi:uncharacterized membrane protein (UPF0136 family)